MYSRRCAKIKCVVFFYQEAIEKKEKRARRFHFCAEESTSQRNVYLDKEVMKKGKKPACVQVFLYRCLQDPVDPVVFFFCGAQLSPDCVWRRSM